MSRGSELAQPQAMGGRSVRTVIKIIYRQSRVPSSPISRDGRRAPEPFFEDEKECPQRAVLEMGVEEESE
jgi:hypothetical protein